MPISKNRIYQKCKYCDHTNIHLKKMKFPDCTLKKSDKVVGCILGLDFLICSDMPKGIKS